MWNSIYVLSPNFEPDLSHPRSGGEAAGALTANRAPRSPAGSPRVWSSGAPSQPLSTRLASAGWLTRLSRKRACRRPATAPSSSSHHTPLYSITAEPVRHDAQSPYVRANLLLVVHARKERAQIRVPHAEKLSWGGGGRRVTSTFRLTLFHLPCLTLYVQDQKRTFCRPVGTTCNCTTVTNCVWITGWKRMAIKSILRLPLLLFSKRQWFTCACKTK